MGDVALAVGVGDPFEQNPASEYRDLTPHGFPDYEVGADGSVWSTRSGVRRKLKPYLPNGRSAGYVVSLNLDGKGSPRSVPRLVLTGFAVAEPAGVRCDPWHLDGDPANCALANLEWRPRRGSSRMKKPKAVHPAATLTGVPDEFRRGVQLRRATLDLTVAAPSGRSAGGPASRRNSGGRRSSGRGRWAWTTCFGRVNCSAACRATY